MIKAPFPYFGGKSKVAHIVWERFGDVPNYVEPFAGSAAVLLARPDTHTGRVETINDFDGYVANFWRAMAHAPEEVALHADWPVNEIDLIARHKYLKGLREEFMLRMREDPEIYDCRVAGWWVWGMSSWLSLDFGSGNRTVSISLANQGVNRSGGVHEQLGAVAHRMRHVRVMCGDWSRVLGDSVTWRFGHTAIFLDPPYPEGNYSYGEGADREVAHQVRDWCKEAGVNPLLRIALCGYDEHDDLLELGWTPHRWKTAGGYGNQSDGTGRENSAREVIWFSPHCLAAKQSSLF